jgi:hypothetical protein
VTNILSQDGRFRALTEPENGLNKLLTSIEDGSLTDQSNAQRDVDRAIATRFWKERNHSRLRRKYIKVPAEFDTKPSGTQQSFPQVQSKATYMPASGWREFVPA